MDEEVDIATVDAAIRRKIPETGEQKRALAVELGVKPSVIFARTKVVRQNKANRGCAINGSLFLAVVTTIAFYWFAGQPSSDAENSEDMTASQKYDNLTPEGKKYTDEKMRQYDEFCAKSDEC